MASSNTSLVPSIKTATSSPSTASLFFPEKVSGVVHHIIQAIYDDEDDLIPIFTYSAPVRIGPLEFRIRASLETCTTETEIYPGYNDEDSDFDPKVDIINYCLIYDNVSPGFPWSGEVEAVFEILEDGKGVPEDWTVDKRKAAVSSDQVKTRGLRAQQFQWSRSGQWQDFPLGDDHYLHKFLDGNNLHVRAMLSLKVGLKSGVEGKGNWKIPLALLNQPSTALKLSVAFPDTLLLSEDGMEFPANRVILAGKSDVFQTMFARPEIKEGMEGKVDIEDIGRKALGMLLKYIYSGSLKEEIENLKEFDAKDFLELVHAGHKYNFPHILMKLAGVALVMRCTKENASELHSALEIYGEGVREARASIAEFIEKNADLDAVVKETLSNLII